MFNIYKGSLYILAEKYIDEIFTCRGADIVKFADQNLLKATALAHTRHVLAGRSTRLWDEAANDELHKAGAQLSLYKAEIIERIKRSER